MYFILPAALNKTNWKDQSISCLSHEDIKAISHRINFLPPSTPNTQLNANILHEESGISLHKSSTKKQKKKTTQQTHISIWHWFFHVRLNLHSFKEFLKTTTHQKCQRIPMTEVNGSRIISVSRYNCRNDCIISSQYEEYYYIVVLVAAVVSVAQY